MAHEIIDEYRSRSYQFQAERALLPEPPPLFRGITRVYAATENPNKLGRIRGFVDSLNIVIGERGLDTWSFVGNSGPEPDWHDALRVALDKTMDTVEAIQKTFGQEALVIGSDVVFWRDGIPMLNLSRSELITGALLNQEVDKLVRAFSKPSVQMWDVATVVSRKGLLAGTGKRIVAGFEAIPEKVIRELFHDDVAGALGRNTQLPLIDDPQLNTHIIGLEQIPLRDLVGNDGSLWEWHLLNAFVDPYELPALPSKRDERQVFLNELRDDIVGGFPSGSVLDELLQLHAYCCGSELKLV